MELTNKLVTKLITVVLLAATLNLSACGYFMYPERVGQTGGRVDPAIVVLDAMGLLFGIIPGVIAFAVDLTTGTIYLSPNEKSVIDKHRDRNAGLNSTWQTFDTAALVPVNPFALPIDTQQLANRLASLPELKGQQINASAIRFYRSEVPQKLALKPARQPIAMNGAW